MACTHVGDCPLFPKLNASLSGWRTHYCDTDDAWTECARYTRGLEGKPVPLALLPNGKMAQVLEPGRMAAVTPYAAQEAAPDTAAVAVADPAPARADSGGRPSWWTRVLAFFRRSS